LYLTKVLVLVSDIQVSDIYVNSKSLGFEIFGKSHAENVKNGFGPTPKFFLLELPKRPGKI